MLACDPMSYCPAAKYSWVHLCAIYTHEKELSRSLGQEPRDLPPPHGNIHRLAGLCTYVPACHLSLRDWEQPLLPAAAMTVQQLCTWPWGGVGEVSYLPSPGV